MSELARFLAYFTERHTHSGRGKWLRLCDFALCKPGQDQQQIWGMCDSFAVWSQKWSGLGLVSGPTAATETDCLWLLCDMGKAHWSTCCSLKTETAEWCASTSQQMFINSRKGDRGLEITAKYITNVIKLATFTFSAFTVNHLLRLPSNHLLKKTWIKK